MSDKDEAMGNFKNAINDTSKVKEEKKEEIKQEQEQKEAIKENEIQEPVPTEPEEDDEPSEEEKAAEEAEDKVRYNIYDDEDEDEDDENSNYNNRNYDKSNRKVDENANEEVNNQNKEDVQDKTDNSNKIDDDSNKTNSDSSNSSKSDAKSDKEGLEKENNINNSKMDTYRANNSTNMQQAEQAEQAANAERAIENGKLASDTGKAATTAKTAAEGAKFVALWKVILIAVIVILFLIIIIGYISFFISGVGLIREKVLKIADGIWAGWVGFWSGDENAVRKEEITDVAEYLEDMGYDLVNFGFLNTDGHQVTIEKSDNGEETIKNYKGKVILQRKIDDETGELKIKKLGSEYIQAYLTAENKTYIIANQNKSVASIWNNLWDDGDDEEHKRANWGTGMIYIEGMSEQTANSLGLTGDGDYGKSKNVKIDRENKKMIITYNNHKYQYDLDGWSGRYGKSLEFLLTLHMATMAPDFVYDVATIEDFDTKVHVALYEIETSIDIVYVDDEGKVQEITEANYSSLGLTSEQWSAIQEYRSDNVKTYTPFITKVTNHWYKNLDFADCYVENENDPNTTKDDEDFTYMYQYVGLGDDSDVLAENENLYVKEIRKNDIFQISEPKVVDNSQKIKQMLLGSTDEENSENTNEDYKYYIYTGSQLEEGQEERKKDYIIKKVNLDDGENKYIMNTRTFSYAFAILESVHSEDAEYVLRDLKELFRDIGIEADELEEDQGNEEIEPLIWPLKDYKPIVWDPDYDAESSIVTIKHQTESDLGFEKDIDFIMPADGEIVQVTKGENEEDGDTVKIRFTGTDREDLKNMYIYVSGIKLDEAVSEGTTYSVKTKIGVTIEKDIRIIMTNSKREAVYNVDDYLQPEVWKFETADEITDSNFQNDIFGTNRPRIGGDYNVNTTSGQNILTKEQILKGLEWYESVNPQGYRNIVDNIDAFMEIQETKNVNAVFAIAVVMSESGAGTGWDYIASYTYNWYSIKGTYEGRSYTDRKGTVWKDYGSYKNATLDFGRLIAEKYFTENRNLVSQIAEKYCQPPDRWAQNVRDNMTKIFENSGADFVRWNETYSTEILAKASELFEKIHNANCYYHQGNIVPINLNNRQIDCSSFVDWVLYELGYSDFGGWQRSTYWWYYDLNPSDYGWTSFYMKDKTMADLQPGDIIVLNGTSYNRVKGTTDKRNHMQIFIGAKDQYHAYAYDCGATSYWSGSTDGSICDSTLWAYTGAKVIRMNK